MQTRYMERSNSMKRSLEQSSNQESQPDKKRPALASVIVEALKLDSLQKLCSSLEPILRRVVSEEVERALAKLGPARLNERDSPKRIDGPDGRNLQLYFRSKLSLPLFTGGKVEGEKGTAIHIVLIDANTGNIVTSGPESSAKLDIIVLEGDFNNEEDEGWTEQEFESHVVKEREGKRPLLNGDLQVTLREGVGSIGELTFTDNSSWIRSRKFRLGLKLASGSCETIRIREAKTDAFTVKDHRGELYKKHYPPALSDEVWRLEKIGKDGSFHKRLNKAGINNVENFLWLVVRDPQRLRTILGSGMSNKMWDVLVDHSKTCVLSGKLYVYYPDDMRNVGVVFNNIYELSGLIASGQYYPADSLSDSQKVFVDSLVKKAYDNWMQVVEYDGKSLLRFTQSKPVEKTGNDYVIAPQIQSNSFDHHQVNLTSLVPSIAPEPSPISPGLRIGGYESNDQSRHLRKSHNMNLNDTVQLESPHNQIMDPFLAHKSEDFLALGPAQSFIPSSHASASNLTPYNGYEEYFTEEEIRIRSHEMLENEDMQHLLRIFNTNGHQNSSSNNNGYAYPSGYTPDTSNFNQTRSSGKAVVGWLKLKAALRWGIFIRKKAAERRAQIVELEDSS